jgi:hypothetical protein
MSDKDADSIGGEPSASWKKLLEEQAIKPNTVLLGPDITLEHELARSSSILPLMIEAFCVLKPKIGQQLSDELDAIEGQDRKADYFYAVFIDKRVPKGRFAQELAHIVDEKSIEADAVPQYIADAMTFLGVTTEDDEDEQSGGTQGTDPEPESN